MEFIYSKDFNDYKNGFAAGIVDFIVESKGGLEFNIDFDYPQFWVLGYRDAYSYYYNLVSDNPNEVVDLDNIDTIVLEMYISLIGQINSLTGNSIPAFSLVLKPNDNKE